MYIGLSQINVVANSEQKTISSSRLLTNLDLRPVGGFSSTGTGFSPLSFNYLFALVLVTDIICLLVRGPKERMHVKTLRTLFRCLFSNFYCHSWIPMFLLIFHLFAVFLRWEILVSLDIRVKPSSRNGFFFVLDLLMVLLSLLCGIFFSCRFWDVNCQSQLSTWFVLCSSSLFNDSLTEVNFRQNWLR